VKKNLVVLTGAGISAESGIPTFRDKGGLWEKYNLEEVATPEGWKKNPKLVLEFYNERRKQLLECQPNKAHYILKELEEYFNVYIITQNVDDLHERAGSTNVLHLHGELRKAQSTVDPNLIYEIKGWQLNWGDKCEKGSQLRPYVVWFGEPVTKMPEAIKITEKADIFVIVGTSLQVYPAASLVFYVKKNTPIFLVDPTETYLDIENLTHIKEKASKGLEILKNILLTSYI